MTNSSLMSAAEVAAKYNVSISSLSTNFPRTQNAILKKYGVTLERSGKGAKTMYYIQNIHYVDPSRAVTLYESIEKNSLPVQEAASLVDLNFLVFIGIISSPQRAFRGNYCELLTYLDMSVTLPNIDLMRQSLLYLQSKGYIMYTEDNTDTMYFMAGIKRQAEVEMELEINAILYFQKLVANSRKSWIPLMKVYLALHFLSQPCTVKDISDATGLTDYKVRDSLAMLEEKNIILKEKKYYKNVLTGEYYCLGQQIDVNAFGIQ